LCPSAVARFSAASVSVMKGVISRPSFDPKSSCRRVPCGIQNISFAVQDSRCSRASRSLASAVSAVRRTAVICLSASSSAKVRSSQRSCLRWAAIGRQTSPRPFVREASRAVFDATLTCRQTKCKLLLASRQAADRLRRESETAGIRKTTGSLPQNPDWLWPARIWRVPQRQAIVPVKRPAWTISCCTVQLSACARRNQTGCPWRLERTIGVGRSLSWEKLLPGILHKLVFSFSFSFHF